MACPACGADVVGFRVPAEFREFLPDDPAVAAVCTRCLRVRPAEDGSDSPSDAAEDPEFDRVSGAFPADAEAAAGVAVGLGLLDRFALYRAEVDELFDRVERAGVDPLLVLEGLAADPDLDPALDLDRRRTQLEQLLR